MTNETHFLGKVAQKAIIVKDGKVLIARDIRDIDEWELPGGRLNIDETPLEGLRREIKEELGVTIMIHEVIHGEQVMHPHKNDPHVFFIYRASLLDENELFDLQPEEVAEVKWITEEELDAQTIYPLYRRALEVFFKTKVLE